MDGRLKLVVSEKEKAKAVFNLLGVTPLTSDGRICPEAIIDQSDLSQFVDRVLSSKASVENILGIEVRSDVRSKPIQQLGSILALVGLRLERAGVQKIHNRKIYRYRVEPVSLAAMKEIVDRRKSISPIQFASEQYGWSADDD